MISEPLGLAGVGALTLSIHSWDVNGTCLEFHNNYKIILF